MSNGHVIKNTCIAVDYWTPGKFLYFLTHCHADHMAKLKHHWWLPIYTSHSNAKWLEEVIKISKHFLRPLNINEEVIIENPYSKDNFTVTLIDARHCPGAVMFYFQGSFGNILYTGDFRYDDQMRTDLILQSIIRKQDVNVLYLDNTYASSTCVFPSREEVMEEILDIIIKHPNSHIYLGLRLLGKEDILWNIYKKLKEKVYVNEKRMKLLKTLRIPTDMCTSKQNESRISVVHFNMLTSSWIEDRRKEGIDCIGIKPTALFTSLSSAKRNTSVSGIYVVPYSDHCSSSELSSFVSDLKPERLYPIINNTKHLGSELSKRMCKIPDFFYDLCRKENINNSKHLCERYQQCNCDQQVSIVNCNKSSLQKYSKNSKYRASEILNRGSEKNHSIGFNSEMSVNKHKIHSNMQHYSQAFHVDLKKSIRNTELLKDEIKKLTALEKNRLKGTISQKNDSWYNTMLPQGSTNTISHKYTTKSQLLNTVQKCSSNTKMIPVMGHKLTAHKMSDKVDTTELNRTESCTSHRFSLLYSKDTEESFIEQRHDSDHLRENPFKTDKTIYDVACNSKLLKVETEKGIQKLKPHTKLENSILDNCIIFHGIKNLNAQTKTPCRENDSNSAIKITGNCTAEPLKKKIKISKKLDL